MRHKLNHILSAHIHTWVIVYVLYVCIKWTHIDKAGRSSSSSDCSRSWQHSRQFIATMHRHCCCRHWKSQTIINLLLCT